jgi:Na+/melibiose symporter-like transporter
MKALIQRIRGERKPVKHDRTPFKQKVCYGVGHIFNDLCIQAWFSYLLIYFTKVVKLSPVNAGYIFLVSQIADALSTPFIGYACDKRISKRIEERYGNKKIWHLIGCAGIALVWPFLYSPCLFCGEGAKEWMVVTYYGIWTALFSFFWPMVEISHLSLLPHVARRAKDALELGAIR